MTDGQSQIRSSPSVARKAPLAGELETTPREANEPTGLPASLRGVLALQRMIGNRAVGRMLATARPGPLILQRMTAEAATQVAIQYGVGKDEAESKAKTGERYDPKAKTWVTPGADEAIYDAFIEAYGKAPNKDKFPHTFEKYKAARASKATVIKVDKTKPINIDSQAELKALWGSSATFEKFERATAIKKLFTDAGYAVSDTVESSSSSSTTPPVLFDVVKHPLIAKFEIHPGGGIHAAPYIRISANTGMIKVINSSLPTAYNRLTETGVTYVDVAIAGATATTTPEKTLVKT